MKLYSWNVNGIRAVQKKGFLDWLQQTSPDILALQETKAHPDQLDPELIAPPGYYTYWASAEKKGYSGVALYSKTEPKSVQLGLGIEAYDREGRTLIAEYEDFTLINAYFPNGQQDHARVPYKMAYKAAFLQHCESCVSAGKPIIFCGDVNTAHQDIDLARPKENLKTTGFLPEERIWIDEVVAAGYVDSFRHFYPDQEGAYTWWSMRSGARQRNIGWRIDFFFVHQGLAERLVDAGVHPEILGSDHCPVSLTLR